MIAIAGTIDVDPHQRDACVTASVSLQEATRRDEPGCLAYCFAADLVVPGRIVVYELWADQASLAAHFDHPNYHDMRAKLHEFGIVKAETRKYRIDHSEPVYDDTRRARADFFTQPSGGA